MLQQGKTEARPRSVLVTRIQLLTATNLIRNTYRSLLQTGRSYAAFAPEDAEFFNRLSDAQHILDPMSGYGGLTQLAASASVNSFALEINEPQYLWQVLTHPAVRHCVLEVAEAASQRKRRSPLCARAHDEFFPPESEAILRRLFEEFLKEFNAREHPGFSSDDLALALLLPFAGRFACLVPTNNPTHVKRGGICVYRDWGDDLRAYMAALETLLSSLPSDGDCDHTVRLGDAVSFDWKPNVFDAMLTSPPYPNRADYASIFRPEHEALRLLRRSPESELSLALRSGIGTTLVSGQSAAAPTSAVVNRFLDEVGNTQRSKSAEYDDRIYYVPYFSLYFSGIHAAYRNVSSALASGARGFVIVVDNTHRGIQVPVSSFVAECFEELGFDAERRLIAERSHIGSKNPRAKGFRAKHPKYVVEIRKAN